ncbi:MAG: NUDIX domain-containing protein [Gammaproteobacteria bacterium]|jgi:8-oxo-dGTP pyrophosphatase MutT (NUDIX family)|nr:NUDIX domain-containing protein [Gammaproteobacteria bacterium]MBT5602614.1 NUDIX domain-containing protein [Gammaproteobacteria bacterium]MBT6244218.1 NUDIX domain-containing protein [Gammaproteobacteria bacterium]
MNDQPIRSAATVILVRDGHPQYEILMLKRTTNTAFAGGMYVFPGGRVDESDYHFTYEHQISQLSRDQLHQKKALGEDWLACWVAAIRETFEESGLLLACTDSGEQINTQDGKVIEYRRQLRNNEIDLTTICAKEGWILTVDQIHFFNRWVTPPGRPRRFDTRFFIGSAPDGQLELHDGEETTESIWISPTTALAENKKGKLAMMAVTIKQLEDLSSHEAAASLIARVESSRDFPHYLPSGATRPDA